MTSPDKKDAVLYMFASESSHDRSVLERYLQQYPEFSEDLIDLSSELRLAETAEPLTTGDSRRDWQAAWQRFQACKPQPRLSSNVVNPFERFRGPGFVELAQALNVSRSFLTAFRDGLVVATSIPNRFAKRFAAATGLTLAEVRCFFECPPDALLARQFKSEDAPSHQGQKTFEELVYGSDLTDDQMKVLMDDLNDNGLD